MYQQQPQHGEYGQNTKMFPVRESQIAPLDHLTIQPVTSTHPEVWTHQEVR